MGQARMELCVCAVEREATVFAVNQRRFNAKKLLDALVVGESYHLLCATDSMANACA